MLYFLNFVGSQHKSLQMFERLKVLQILTRYAVEDHVEPDE
jgi:hypothetical protein